MGFKSSLWRFSVNWMASISSFWVTVLTILTGIDVLQAGGYRLCFTLTPSEGKKDIVKSCMKNCFAE
jgi:hypothetical protein